MNSETSAALAVLRELQEAVASTNRRVADLEQRYDALAKAHRALREKHRATRMALDAMKRREAPPPAIHVRIVQPAGATPRPAEKPTTRRMRQAREHGLPPLEPLRVQRRGDVGRFAYESRARGYRWLTIARAIGYDRMVTPDANTCRMARYWADTKGLPWPIEIGASP